MPFLLSWSILCLTVLNFSAGDSRQAEVIWKLKADIHVFNQLSSDCTRVIVGESGYYYVFTQLTFTDVNQNMTIFHRVNLYHKGGHDEELGFAEHDVASNVQLSRHSSSVQFMRFLDKGDHLYVAIGNPDHFDSVNSILGLFLVS